MCRAEEAETHQAGGVHGHDDRLLLLTREQLHTLKQQVRKRHFDGDQWLPAGGSTGQSPV